MSLLFTTFYCPGFLNFNQSMGSPPPNERKPMQDVLFPVKDFYGGKAEQPPSSKSNQARPDYYRKTTLTCDDKRKVRDHICAIAKITKKMVNSKTGATRTEERKLKEHFTALCDQVQISKEGVEIIDLT